jgi:hypothetical protein
LLLPSALFHCLKMQAICVLLNQSDPCREEYERLTQLLKSKTKGKRPLEANRRPDEVVGKQTVQEDSIRKQILKEPQDSPRVNLEERRTEFDKSRMMREKDEGELEYVGARGLQVRHIFKGKADFAVVAFRWRQVVS